MTTIDYATPPAEDLAVARWLRRTVGWAAVAYGALSCASQTWYVALSRKWVSAALDFGPFSRTQNVLALAFATALALTCAAGVLVIRGRPGAVRWMRIGLALAIALPYAERAHAVLGGDGMTWQWQSLNTGWTLSQSVLPALLIALTFGPSGRAIRGLAP